ncbi:SprA-related family protein [Duganella sp. CF458]|uniref:putative metalloprotease CJM1_0395 family protein n=1 Tax=Duganella sp. CF458 TaxID=1884368 RepID=UPI0008F22CB5|nr:putative metalloprotease CJM1_0395 family protein [Duganella sp. CF458]SFF94086.1 SprA-related family protein [Duganella sp. CF458]
MGIGAISSSSSYAPQASAPARNATRSERAQSAQQEYSPEDRAKIDQLKARDLQVRQHEQAHLAAAGSLATSGATYTYQRGPNGVNYAVGGEVNIDTSAGRTPEETISKARQIQAAALAPADPSGQDRSVAARAGQMAQQAQAEISAKQQEVQRGYGLSEKQATIDIFA